MVLDEASPSATDTFAAEDPGSSDVDPYASAPYDTSSSDPKRPAQLPPSVNLREYARPIPILGRVLGYSDSRLKMVVELDGAAISRILQRPLTLPEWEATTFHMAKMQSYASYGWPIGIAIGSWRAYRTMDSWRFPFFKPDLERVGHRFDSFGTLKGQSARQAWQVMRFTSHSVFWGLNSKLICTVYAISVAWTGQRMDQRLSEFWNTLQALPVEEARRRREGMAGRAPSNQENRRTQTQRPPDERISQGGQGAWQRQRDAAARRQTATPAGNDRSESTQAPLSSDFDFDDASPTAKDFQEEASASQETAWDRLRRGGGAASTSAQQPPGSKQSQGDAWARARGQGRGTTSKGQGDGDSFSFSSSDEDRQLARDEAQQEFDRRIDRERQGKNFGGSSYGS